MSRSQVKIKVIFQQVQGHSVRSWASYAVTGSEIPSPDGFIFS